jgi:hypothetical protein
VLGRDPASCADGAAVCQGGLLLPTCAWAWRARRWTRVIRRSAVARPWRIASMSSSAHDCQAHRHKLGLAPASTLAVDRCEVDELTRLEIGLAAIVAADSLTRAPGKREGALSPPSLALAPRYCEPSNGSSGLRAISKLAERHRHLCVRGIGSSPREASMLMDQQLASLVCGGRRFGMRGPWSRRSTSPTPALPFDPARSSAPTSRCARRPGSGEATCRGPEMISQRPWQAPRRCPLPHPGEDGDARLGLGRPALR